MEHVAGDTAATHPDDDHVLDVLPVSRGGNGAAQVEGLLHLLGELLGDARTSHRVSSMGIYCSWAWGTRNLA